MTDPRPVCTEKTQDIIKTLRSNVQVEAALELAVKQQEKRIADQIILTETPAPPFQIGRASCRKECRSRWSPYH